jgi:hypothetical protein
MNADTAFPDIGINRRNKWYLRILNLKNGIKNSRE